MFEFLKQLTDPESIIKYGGFTLLLFVIFAETGLFVGFFLPGDNLVFIAGLLCAMKPELMNVSFPVMIAGMIAAAVLGNVFGYWFGKKAGETLYKRNDSFFSTNPLSVFIMSFLSPDFCLHIFTSRT